MTTRYDSRMALLANLIDYAGTFPPAALSLDKALEEAATYGTALKNPWLYSKMTLPIEDLKKISARDLMEKRAEGRCWIFTSLSSKELESAATPADMATAVEWDLRAIRRINERGYNSPCRFFISAYEMKLPADILENVTGEKLVAALDPIFDRLNKTEGWIIHPFMEIPLSAEWKKTLPAIFEALHDLSEDETGNLPPLGVKIRTGGKVMPTPEQLSSFVALTVQHGFRFKATQGLHAAVTHGRDYGFVNLFAALTLAQALGQESFPTKQIEKCLISESAKEFAFSDENFSWGAFELGLDQIESARRRHAGAFGSCSLKEPDDSLSEVFPSKNRSRS